MTTTSQTGSIQQSALPAVFSAVRDALRERRAAREEFNRIERELASYTSPADLAELDAMIERSDIDNDTVYTEIIERVRLRAA